MKPIVGYVIRPGIGEASDLLRGPQRILAINQGANSLWLIGLSCKENDPHRRSHHRTGPRCYSLEAIVPALDRGALIMEKTPIPSRWQISDADYLCEAPTDRERALRQKRLDERDARWVVVEAIVGRHSAIELVSTAHLLRKEVLNQAAIHSVSVPTVYSWLHQYWAGGECLNSLLPSWGQCGGPGKRKASGARRLGRKSRLFKNKLIETEGYVLADGDAERLALGYSLVKPGVTVRDAFVRTSAAFWSELIQDEHGHAELKLRSPHLRPTQPQFEYWGRQLHGNPLRRRMLGVDRWNTSTLAVAGSTQDQVHAVGQMAMIDSTSTDVYLTSSYSRLKPLPPMHRTIIVDVRSTLMMGWYIGWEAPSSETSLQAMLCAVGNKVEIAAQFGIKIGDDDLPGMLHRIYLADNGETKCVAMVEAERNFRFGLEFVKSNSGQSKSQVESQHHADHKALDHKLPGTTHGRQRKRGEPHPACEALWTYREYMEEFVLGVIAYNNQEVPDLAPTDMKIAGVPPTRLNVFRWLRDHNMRADIPCDVDHLRAYALPDRSAVMRRDGVHLLMEDGIRYLPGNRFYIDDLQRDHRWQRAAEHQSSVSIKVKFDGKDLRYIWLATSEGLLRIPNVLADLHTQNEVTLVDFTQHISVEDLRLDLKKEDEDQQDVDKLLRRHGKTTHAKRQKLAELRLLPKKLSKKDQVADLRKNRDEELARQKPIDVLHCLEVDRRTATTSTAQSYSVADLAMEIFQKGVSK
jgi:hypothetical protein